MSRLHLWYLPPAFFSQAGHGGGELPAFPAPSRLAEGGRQRSLGSLSRGNAELCPMLSSW